MGYSLSPYAVDFDAMSAKVRNGDTEVFHKMMKKHGKSLDSYQEYLDDAHENEAYDNQKGGGVVASILSIFKKKAPEPEPEVSEDAISAEEALRHLTVGGDFVSYGGTAYGYMYEWLCEEFGKGLKNDHWASLRSSSGWTSIIDDALAKNGIKSDEFSVEGTLMARGAPLGFPFGDDFPYIGYVTNAECKALNEKFAALDLQAIASKTEHADHALGALKEMHDWFKTCAESNRGLMCFYY